MMPSLDVPLHQSIVGLGWPRKMLNPVAVFWGDRIGSEPPRNGISLLKVNKWCIGTKPSIVSPRARLFPKHRHDATYHADNTHPQAYRDQREFGELEFSNGSHRL